MRRAAVSSFVLVTLVACSDVPTVTLPEGAATTMRSVVYALELADGELEVSVARIDDPLDVEVGPDVDFLRVLLYEDDVTLAFRDRGRLAETSPEGRGIPVADVGYLWALGDDRSTPDWQSSPEPSGRLALFRTPKSDACETFAVERAPLPFSGGAVTDARFCDAPCSSVWYTSDGSVHTFLRGTPLDLDQSAMFGTSAMTGALVYALESTGAQYVGYEKGYFAGAGMLQWFGGDWDEAAVRYRFGQGPGSFIAYALLDTGVVRTQDPGGPWSELVDLGTSPNRPFLEFKPPDVFEAYRDSGWTRVSDGRAQTFELPIQGNISSLRKIIRDGTVIRVLGTDIGEMAFESGVDEWTALRRTGTQAPVVGADYWLDAWLVFDAAGLLHQQRLDGTLCEPFDVLDGETALGMFATQAGYHIWSEDTLAFVTLVRR